MVEIQGGTTRAIVGDGIDEYLALVRAFPLVSIREDAHLDAAVMVIDGFIDKPTRSAAEEAYLGALTDLVETYENAHVVFPPQTGVDALRSLIEENSLKQGDLVPIFGTQSIVSEVLNGKRKLTVKHIEKLSAFFHVSPSVFFDDPGAD
jgi:HTH-type transcriptional regulator/antitoxin HigA